MVLVTSYWGILELEQTAQRSRKLRGDKNVKSLANNDVCVVSRTDLCFSHTSYQVLNTSKRTVQSIMYIMDGDKGSYCVSNAMINYPHFVIQKESPKVYQQRMIHGRRMPRNELNVLDVGTAKASWCHLLHQEVC